MVREHHAAPSSSTVTVRDLTCLGAGTKLVVKTARVAAKVTQSFGAKGSLSAGLSYEGQSLYHPIVNQVFVDFDGPGPNPPVEVFSLLIDTDHRDLGAMVRYDQRMGTHDLLVGLNYGDGSVEGGNYRNLNGQPNGISEYVDNTADSVEAFVVDRWRASDRWTVVFGGQAVSAARNVLTTNATTGAVSNPNARYSTFNPRAGVIASVNRGGEVYGNVSRLFEAPTTFQMMDDMRRQRHAPVLFLANRADESHEERRSGTKGALRGCVAMALLRGSVRRPVPDAPGGDQPRHVAKERIERCQLGALLTKYGWARFRIASGEIGRCSIGVPQCDVRALYQPGRDRRTQLR